MDRRTFARLFAGVVATGCVDTARAAESDARDARAAESDVETTARVDVESWDGTAIAATVYRPTDRGPHPALLMTHGYGNTRDSVAGAARRYARAGYLVLTYDSRGFGDSGGESTFDGPAEVADALTLVDRLGAGTVGDASVDVRRSNNGPAVGMDGGSYAGGIQLNTAAATPDRLPDGVDGGSFESFALARGSPLDAIVPRITWNDLLEAAAPNRVVKRTWDAFILAAGAEGYERDGRPTGEGPDPRLYEYTAEALATNRVPDEARAYFAARSPDPTAIAEHGVPTLLVQGWPDNLLPPNQALANFRGIRAADADTEAAVVFYPGGHDERLPTESTPEGAVSEYLDAVSLAWLDRHVRGDASRWRRGGFRPVSFYQQQYPDVPAAHRTGPYPAWRCEAAFPPEGADPVALDLAGATATDRTAIANSVAATSARGPTGSLFGSPGVDAPGTSAAFDFAATAPVDVVGAPRLDLTVTPLGEDPAVFAKAALVDRAGDATVVDEQVMPFRIGGAAGERTTVAFDAVAFQRYVGPGERLRLVLAATDNGYVESRTAAGLVVHHADSGESSLTVPAVADADDPFEAAPLPERAGGARTARDG